MSCVRTQADRDERATKLNLVNVGVTYSGSKGEKIEAIRDITMSVGAGEFIAIVGPSGCGKTTLLRVVAGLLAPTQGEVCVDGERVRGPGADRGMVFQDYSAFPWLTVYDNVAFGLRLRGHLSGEAREMVSSYLRSVGLEEFAHAYPKELSGGMLQRVALARSLVNKPSLLLMDEPFGALDYQTRWDMRQLLLRVWRTLGATVIFVTHDAEEAVFLANTVYACSPRPAVILRRVVVPLGENRGLEIVQDPAFRNILDALLGAHMWT